MDEMALIYDVADESTWAVTDEPLEVQDKSRTVVDLRERLSRRPHYETSVIRSGRKNTPPRSRSPDRSRGDRLRNRSSRSRSRDCSRGDRIRNRLGDRSRDHSRDRSTGVAHSTSRYSPKRLVLL